MSKLRIYFCLLEVSQESRPVFGEIHTPMSSRAIKMNYCTQCGEKVAFVIPHGDNMPRYVCKDPQCGFVHYQNPKIVAGCIVQWQNNILLCRRAIEPRSGLWTIPAGFLENGETVDGGALRETVEEACAEVKSPELFAVYNIPHVNQVYIIFCGNLAKPQFAPGEESLETKLFAESEVPWDELAFPVVRKALQRFFEDKRKGDFRPFVDDLP